MKKFLKALGIIIGALLVLLLVVPFLIPVPPLENTVPAEGLTDPDSKFIEVNGLNVHYKIFGQGEPVFILLHGFGASLLSWHEVTAPLSELGTVIAHDRHDRADRSLHDEQSQAHDHEPQHDAHGATRITGHKFYELHFVLL